MAAHPIAVPGATRDDDRVNAVREAVAAVLPGVRADLADLVRIPSVSADPGAAPQVERSARAVQALLTGTGLPEVTVLRARRPDGSEGAPAVVGRRPAPPGAPTVMLYAHHDVQPTGTLAGWASPPFEPTERNGRLYGRGAADDKAGVAVHVGALRALLPTWGPHEGVGLVVFVEGEEEIGSPSFADFLERYRDLLEADVIVVADSDNWSIDSPSLTTSLRGLVDARVSVATLDHAVHSGMYGGPVPDAMTALIRLLDRLRDPAGALDVAGLHTGTVADPGLDEAQLREESGMLEGVGLLGAGPLAERLWARPSLTVTATDAPAMDAASNTLAARASARLSLRVAPGQDPAEAYAALRDHLVDSAPFGAHVEVELLESGRAFSGEVTGPVYDAARAALSAAWDGAEVVHAGIGGSIPFVAELLDTFPAATVLVTGVEDPDSRAHGHDESLSWTVLERALLAEALLLASLGVPAEPAPPA